MINLLLAAALATVVVGADGLPVPQNRPTEIEETEEEITHEGPVRITCVGCTENEQKTAEFFFDQGVTDKNALAVVLGNIRQESGFNPAVCEGGSLKSYTPYSSCRRGGYGLIQFTSSHRYYGLGRYARSIGKTPEDFETQLEYITTEREWKAAYTTFQTPDLSIAQYNRAAYTWLGWGVAGRRVNYAYQYATKLITT